MVFLTVCNKLSWGMGMNWTICNVQRKFERMMCHEKFSNDPVHWCSPLPPPISSITAPSLSITPCSPASSMDLLICEVPISLTHTTSSRLPCVHSSAIHGRAATQSQAEILPHTCARLEQVRSSYPCCSAVIPKLSDRAATVKTFAQNTIQHKIQMQYFWMQCREQSST